MSNLPPIDPAYAAAIRERRMERRRRQKTLQDLLLRGYRDTRMLADHFQVSTGTIKNDIRQLDARWEQCELDLTNRRKARLIAELQLLKRQAWQAFEESKKPDYEEQEVDVEPGQDGTKPGKKVTRKRSGPRTGDAAYMARIADCIAKEMVILGIRPPPEGTISQQVTINQAVGAMSIDLSRLTPEVTAILCGEIDQIDREQGLIDVEEPLELPEAPQRLSEDERASAQAELGLKPFEE